MAIYRRKRLLWAGGQNELLKEVIYDNLDD